MSREDFNQDIQNMTQNNKSNELTTAINRGINMDILYEALRNVYLIAYNSIPSKDKEGKMAGVFKFDDINIASISFNNLVKEFINLNDSKNDAIEKSLVILEKYYHIAASSTERASKSGMVNNKDRSNFGFVGTFYILDRIPEDIWGSIKNDFINKCIF